MDYRKNSNTITDEERKAFMDRFKTACRRKGMSVGYLQGVLGKANAYFRNMGYISPRMVSEVKKYIPDLNIEYINTGVGSMFLTLEETAEEQVKSKRHVPLVPLSSRVGTLLALSDGLNHKEHEMILSPVEGPELALSVTDDSMFPECSKGSVAYIKRISEKTFYEWGKTYALDTCNGILLRKIFPSENETNIICRSANANNYPDIEIKQSDIYGYYKVLAFLTIK